MHQAAQPRTLRDYLQVLVARKWLIIGVTLIATAIGVAYSLLRSPTYDATAVIQFRPPQLELGVFTPGVQLPADVNPSETASANSGIVTRGDVIRAAQKSTGADQTTGELRGDVTATVQPTSNLINITVSNGNAALAAQLANAVAQQTKKVAAQLERRQFDDAATKLQRALSSGQVPQAAQGAYGAMISRAKLLSRVADPVQVVRSATTPASPSSPRPVLDTGLAAVLGLILGIGAAFLRNTLDRRITDSREIERELGLSLVGYVHSDALGLAGGGRNGDAVPEDDLEAFRILRTNVGFLTAGRSISSLVVTSAVAEEGKSTVAGWYAYVNAAAGRRTLLVDCDFRRPVLATRWGVDATPGVSDYLAGNVEREEIVRSVDVHGREVDAMSLMPSGANPIQPADMIESEGFKRLIDEIERQYEMVVFDTAPLLPVSDTLELIPQVDAMLLCVRIGQTTHSQVQAAKQALANLPEKPTGVVITGVKRGGGDDYYGYSSYSRTTTATTD